MEKAIVFLLLILAVTLHGQTSPIDSLPYNNKCRLSTEDYIFTKTETTARFRGGSNQWFVYAARNFDYEGVIRQMPDSQQVLADSIEVRFVVDRKGKTCNFEQTGGNSLLYLPARKLLVQSPDWMPATNASRALNSYRTLKMYVFIDKTQHKYELTGRDPD